ncbi:N-(5'-phosphoribosyl)anthranilate isomerase [Polycladomyces abyssicola]|uniref:N-(5'-phosphoribosyl)anthranilate isomerase n=1 Tax=Polycladomyces abyssicola TaxID=1125966 RepID=A0A8D5ZNC2_9BACL|nr:phosphoribosylanthranilate isomerase [Polycladomyces abyssicola]BCU81797.1 N-(5'-phosphoribosyl)anthranilate isomerase [Polycladomyces abyssicola]
MRTSVKICGLQTEADAETLYGLDVDTAGVILVPGRRRTVPETRLPRLLAALPPSVKAVAVLQNASLTEAERWLKRYPFSAVQLHGDESPAYCRLIKETCGVDVIKAFSVDSDGPLPDPDAYAQWIDTALFDSAGGGSGQSFSWERIPEIRRIWRETPCAVWVAGGLTADNVERLVTEYRPDGVDVSSGVETNGRKDPEKIQAFVERVKAGENRTPIGNPS